MSRTAPAVLHNDAQQQRRVLRVAKVVSATLGREFFQSLVEQLATTLAAEYSCIAEVAVGAVSRLHTVAAWRNGQPTEEPDQNLSGSCGGQVLLDGAVVWSKRARQIFPEDDLLERLGAESYIGVRLCDSVGRVIGLVAVAGHRPIRDAALAKSVLEAFGPRAAAELERKRAEEESREAEQRYRAFVTSSADGMWRIEFDRPVSLNLPEEEQIAQIYRYGYLAECNPAFAAQLGAGTPDDLVGTQFSALFPLSDERVRREVVAFVRARYRLGAVQTTPVDEDGRKLYRLRTHCGIVENDELRRVWGTTRDITELKRAELAVVAAERRFRTVLEQIGTPVLMLDPGGSIVFCNDSLVRLARSSRDRLTGTNWLEWIEMSAERDTWRDLLFNHAGEDGPASHFESMLHLRGAEPRLLVWDTMLLEDEERQPAGLAAIGRDITAERALETQLAHARRLDSIGRLAAGISHDFNNLLTLIVGNVSILVDKIDREAEAYPTLLAVKSAADDCAALTQQLLEIGRGQSLRPQTVSLNAIVAAEQPTLRAMIGASVDLVTVLDPEAGCVYADPGQLRRILANLATNARDAMPGGGSLRIATFNVDIGIHPSPDHPDVPPGAYVALTVTDTGVGLSDEVREHMFDPFFTTKSPGKGTGLGLATVYGFVTQSGGCISASGETGKGATMKILLPRTAPA